MRNIIPKSRAGQFVFFFLESFICIFVIVANTRALAVGSYFWTFVTETLFGAQCFLISKFAIEDENARSWAAGIGGILGGTTAAMLSLWCSKHLFGGA